MILNRTVSAGVSTQQFYMQLRPKRVSFANKNKQAFKMALCLGLQTLDCADGVFMWEGELLSLEDVELNFFIPQATSIKSKSDYTLKILTPDSVGELATFQIQLKQHITEFIFKNRYAFEVILEADKQIASLQATLFIHQSRVNLLEEVRKYLHERSDDMLLRVTTEPALDMGKTKQDKQTEWANINNIVKSVFKEKQESEKSNSPLTIKIPKRSEPTQTFEQIDSPLRKIMERPNLDKLKKPSKHASNDVLKIRRTDSVDEDEQLTKKRVCRVFLVILVMLFLSYYFFSSGTKKIKKQQKKLSSRKQNKKQHSARRQSNKRHD